MEKLRKLPIGVQSFEKIRKGNYVYVDKTKKILQLINEGTYCFLSRPRRFGKSLLISTLKAYFLGQKELFKDLFIDTVEKQWIHHPVIHLDLNSGIYDTEENLRENLNYHLSEFEKQYHITSTTNDTLEARFSNIIKTAYNRSGKGVVVLVDEYDKPLLQTIDNEELHGKFKTILKGVYSVLKTCDEYIRFGMLTGVTKFSQVSLFSDLNNLTDISLDEKYADICGLTVKEIEDNFDEYLHNFAKKEQTTKEEILSQLKAMYDGYHFTEDADVDIYNPFSVLNALNEQRFRNYWFQTGTPTFLWKLLQANNYNIQDFSTADIVAKDLTSKENMKDSPIALFYQTGYLTIKGFNRRSNMYQLGYPNKEVEESFLDYLMPKYLATNESTAVTYLDKLYKALEKGDAEDFLEKLKSLFASTPYELIKDTENHYQTVVFIVCKLLGYIVQAESHTSNGRIDMYAKTDNFIYLFEFKFNRSSEEALNQIEDKGYAYKFQQDKRKLFKIGVNFTSEKKNIADYLIKEA